MLQISYEMTIYTKEMCRAFQWYDMSAHSLYAVRQIHDFRSNDVSHKFTAYLSNSTLFIRFWKLSKVTICTRKRIPATRAPFKNDQKFILFFCLPSLFLLSLSVSPFMSKLLIHIMICFSLSYSMLLM